VNAACRFDWYEVTFDGEDEGLAASRLAARLSARAVQGKGRNGYAISYAIVRGDDELCRVFGRSARPGECHVVTSGVSCDEVVPIIREWWPVHRVSRADVSSDFAADFDVLDAIAVEFAAERGVSYRLVSDSAGGASRYLGAVSSETRVVVYKKSEQLRALNPDRADTVPDGIVRVEFRIRPGKRHVKERAATMQPPDFWGFSRWTQQFAERILFVDAERASTHDRRPSEWSRLLATFRKQYAPGMHRRVLEVGRDAVVADLLDALGLTDPDTPF
jgi:hypothetical protein